MNILVPDAQCPLSGIETLNLRLLPEMARLGHRIIWAVPEHRLYTLRSESRQMPDFQLISIEWPKSSPLRWVGSLLRRLEKKACFRTSQSKLSRLRQRLHQRRLKQLVRRHGIQQVLYTWTLGEPIPELGTPIFALVHDLNWRRYPQNFPETTPAVLDAQTLAWIKKSKKIFTFSHAVRVELNAFAPQFGDKYHPILLATDVPAHRPRQIAAQANVRTGRMVFYYPATVSAHKNHLALFRAAALVRRLNLDFELVLSGAGTEDLLGTQPLAGFMEDIRQIFWSAQDLFAGRVRALGYVSREALDEAFARADCIVLPSFFEGFGLPLTEGLGWGRQIICSDITPYAEQIAHYQVSDWVRVFDPCSAEALAEHMQRVITRPRPGPDACSAIALSVSRWTWAEVAKAYSHELR